MEMYVFILPPILERRRQYGGGSVYLPALWPGAGTDLGADHTVLTQGEGTLHPGYNRIKNSIIN
jgi:hypothetical protein